MVYKIEPRKEVQIFTSFMEYKLRKNDHKGGWEKRDFKELIALLIQEVAELEEALLTENYADIMLESADIANFAMMIAWNALNLNSFEKEEKNG